MKTLLIVLSFGFNIHFANALDESDNMMGPGNTATVCRGLKTNMMCFDVLTENTYFIYIPSAEKCNEERTNGQLLTVDSTVKMINPAQEYSKVGDVPTSKLTYTNEDGDEVVIQCSKVNNLMTHY